MKILVVDDSKAMRMIIRKQLRLAGFGGLEIIEAANGAEALPLFRSEFPDFVLSDWNMPEMSGIELLESIQGESKRVRFGFVTSEGTLQMRLRAKEAGAAFLLTKPFTPDGLRSALQPHLGQS